MFEAENLKNAIQNINDSEIGSGATLSQDYVDVLNAMLANGLITEE